MIDVAWIVGRVAPAQPGPPPTDTPFRVTCHVADELVEKRLRELRFVLDLSRPSAGRTRLASHLAETHEVIVIAMPESMLDPTGAVSPAARVALGALVPRLAQEVDGVIEVELRDGRSHVFWDAEGKQFYRL
jgi:hypothetical protein